VAVILPVDSAAGVLEFTTEHPHITRRHDGFWFYDPTNLDDGPYPTIEICEAAFDHYMEYIF